MARAAVTGRDGTKAKLQCPKSITIVSSVLAPCSQQIPVSYITTEARSPTRRRVFACSHQVSSASTSQTSSRRSLAHQRMSYAPLADEVNPPFSKATPAARVTRSGTVTYRQSEEDAEHDSGDLGDLPRFSRQDKGKGKARAFDVERGPEPVDASAAYPPISSEEEDERRIQAVSRRLTCPFTELMVQNLSRLAARDQAERRARQSRLFPRPLSIWPDRDRIAGDNVSRRSDHLSGRLSLYSHRNGIRARMHRPLRVVDLIRQHPHARPRAA